MVPGGPETVLVFHGAHLRAGIPLGERVLAAAGATVLIPSRPGYGRTRTPRAAPSAFADAAAELCRRLGRTRPAAVVGASTGGPTAIAMAARHPALVRRLALVGAVGAAPWPDPPVRRAARLAFAPAMEAATWAGVRGTLRSNPVAGLRSLLAGLSTEPPDEVLDRMPPPVRARLTGLFCRMRSGSGFLHDLRAAAQPLEEVRLVEQPALVAAARKDGLVPFAQADALAAALPEADRLESAADHHFVWFGPDRAAFGERLAAFLAEGR